MGGKSSSKNQTTTTNVSGQNAIQGNNLGTAISGVNNSTITVTATDNGAIEGAFAFAGDALDDLRSGHSESLQMVAGLAGNQAQQNTQNMNTLMELAKFNQDGGASQNKQQQIIMTVIIAVILGAVAIAALKHR